MNTKCINGRVNPHSDTKLRLFADSAGYCCRPTCNKYLFSDLELANYHFGEVAHIIAASATGPRSVCQLTANEKALYDNLILLCPSCHREIDKAPELFPADLVREWKSKHKTRIIDIMSLPVFQNRQDARIFVANILRRNKVVFDSLNPDLPYRENPEAEEATLWKRKMLTQIIPNNQRILLFLELNSSLLRDSEMITIEHFRQHVDDLVQRHWGENLTIASRFPTAISNILLDEL